MNKGVFLDRDGVINLNVFNEATREWESPHQVEDFQLFPWAIESLRQLQAMGYYLFLVSNQPSHAKGKASLENIKAIHEKFHSILNEHQIPFREYYYCYHHPDGVIPEYSINCTCRKPGTAFLEKAREAYGLDMHASWMIGDRDLDILCGSKAGVRTILVSSDDAPQRKKTGECVPDFKVHNLQEAANIIIQCFQGRENA